MRRPAGCSGCEVSVVARIATLDSAKSLRNVPPLDILLDDRERFQLDAAIVAESSQPVHFGLAPKPGHLTFRIVAMGLPRRFQSELSVNLAAKHLHCLLVA